MTAPDTSETLAPNPVERSSYDECARALSVLATREGRREVYVKITEKAGFDLLPAASWMLLRIRRHGTVEPARLAEVAPVPLRVINDAARQLEGRGLVRRVGVQMVLTEPGAEAVVKLAQAREDSLAELLGDWWGPDRPTDLVALVSELTRETSGSSKERPHSPEPKRDHAAGHPYRD